MRKWRAHNRPLKAEIRSLETSLLQEAGPFVDKLLEERLADLPETLRQELRTLAHTPQDYEGGELSRKFLVSRELTEDETSEVRRLSGREVQENAADWPGRPEPALSRVRSQDRERPQTTGRGQGQAAPGALCPGPHGYRRPALDHLPVEAGQPPVTWRCGHSGRPGRPDHRPDPLPSRLPEVRPGFQRPPPGAGALADPARTSADFTGPCEPGLAQTLRPGTGPQPLQLRPIGGASHPPPTAGLAGHRIRQPGLEHQGPAPDHDELHRLPPDLADRPRGPGAGPRKRFAVANAERGGWMPRPSTTPS